MADQATLPPIAFPVGSQYSVRQSFTVAPIVLQAATPSPVSPQQIPASGYISGILLNIHIAGTGGTTPALSADAPFNLISSINLRNAAGFNLIAPIDGYTLYVMNKYGGQVPGQGAVADPKFGFRGAPSAYAADMRFFLWVPIVIDPEEAYGAIPALASNQNYQLEISLNSQANVTTSNPTLTVDIQGTVHYFDQPPSQAPNGAPYAQTPDANGTVSQWLVESPTVSPGTQLVPSLNVGNVVRNHIFILRNSAGARIDTNGWPALFEEYLDNDLRFQFRQAELEFMMTKWFGLNAATKDVAGGLDTGVYALPYHALLGSGSGDPSNTRAQLLSTLSTTLLQFKATDFGSAASRFQIVTEQVVTTNAAYLYSK